MLTGACSQNANDMLDICPYNENSKSGSEILKNYCISSNKITCIDPKFGVRFENKLRFGV